MHHTLVCVHDSPLIHGISLGQSHRPRHVQPIPSASGSDATIPPPELPIVRPPIPRPPQRLVHQPLRSIPPGGVGNRDGYVNAASASVTAGGGVGVDKGGEGGVVVVVVPVKVRARYVKKSRNTSVWAAESSASTARTGSRPNT